MVPAGQSMLVRAPHWRPPTSLSDWPAENSRLWPPQAETQNRTVAPQSGANFSLTSSNNNIGQQKTDNSSTTRAPHVTMTSSAFQDVKFSDRHNALYLYFSRLMGLVEFLWGIFVLKSYFIVKPSRYFWMSNVAADRTITHLKKSVEVVSIYI